MQPFNLPGTFFIGIFLPFPLRCNSFSPTTLLLPHSANPIQCRSLPLSYSIGCHQHHDDIGVAGHGDDCRVAAWHVDGVGGEAHDSVGDPCSHGQPSHHGAATTATRTEKSIPISSSRDLLNLRSVPCKARASIKAARVFGRLKALTGTR
jgi:hypothetical protein